MAKEELLDDSEAQDGAAAAAEPPRSKKFLILGGIAAVLFVVGVPVAILAFRGSDKVQEEALVQEFSEDGLVPEGYNDEDELDEGEEPLGAILPFDTLVVNLSEGGYLRMQVQLEFDAQDIPRRAYVRLVPIRDAMITLLSSRSAAELLSANGKNHLRSDLRELVNSLLRKELVKEVYFTQFVIQQS